MRIEERGVFRGLVEDVSAKQQAKDRRQKVLFSEFSQCFWNSCIGMERHRQPSHVLVALVGEAEWTVKAKERRNRGAGCVSNPLSISACRFSAVGLGEMRGRRHALVGVIREGGSG